MPRQLPVIYESPRFDEATPTLKPVIDRAIRFGATIGIEWGTLTLIEDAPRYLKVATVVIAVLILSVHESWPWLRMRNRRLYPAFMLGLLLTFLGILAFATFWGSHSPRILSTSDGQSTTAAGDFQSTFLMAGPPFAGRVVVGGPYLPEEISTMIQAAGGFSDILHLEIKPAFETAQSCIEQWDRQLQNEGSTVFAAKLTSLASKLTDSSHRIDKILSNNARFDLELGLTVHDRSSGPFVQELTFFSSDILATADLSSPARAAILKSDLQRLRSAVGIYDNWVQAATDNVDYKSKSLRAYKPRNLN